MKPSLLNSVAGKMSRLKLVSNYLTVLQSLPLQAPSIRCFSLEPARGSVFSPRYVDPVFKKERLRQMKETGEAAKLAHLPIKPAKSEDTCSVFHDPLVEKFINYVMRCGNKELARNLVNKAFETVKRIQVEKYNRLQSPEEKEKVELNALNVFHKAVENCKPIMQLTPIKRGGATYQVPVPISNNRAMFLAMNWLIEQGKAEPRTVRFYIKLANELVSASQNQGRTVKRKQDLHKQCEANRAYAHYRWG